ncbi:MAG: chemotaxis protein CheW [Candidatus Goldiibacteriota bacterium]|jgi:purine-binding chemotaxis protein CheW
MEPMKGQEKSIGELLIQANYITKEQLDEALEKQRLEGAAEPIGKLLVRMHYVREENIISVLKGILVVVVELKGERFGLEIVYSREIVKCSKITKLPNMPPHILGMMSLRDEVIPVISLSKKIFGTNEDLTDESRVIVVEQRQNLAGFLVDRVLAVKNFQASSFANITKYTFTVDKKFIAGLLKDGEDVITLIKPEILFEQNQPS